MHRAVQHLIVSACADFILLEHSPLSSFSQPVFRVGISISFSILIDFGQTLSNISVSIIRGCVLLSRSGSCRAASMQLPSSSPSCQSWMTTCFGCKNLCSWPRTRWCSWSWKWRTPTTPKNAAACCRERSVCAPIALCCVAAGCVMRGTRRRLLGFLVPEAQRNGLATTDTPTCFMFGLF